ncbi:MAG: phosphate ABC transporter substrate-binding protein PstS family protein [Alphaproteobacteria bacterium]|nr:phosphate ABC transporter substrate-binding protein PstS family protein [Alphaproteobacteria bacterium]
MRWAGLTGAACAAILGLLAAACDLANGLVRAPQTIRVDGSSTVFPLSEAAAEGFSIENRGGVRVTVGESGTGGGFRRFCRGETEVQGASRPIKQSEMDSCRDAGIAYVELPVAFDGITVVVNKDNPIDTVTVEQLRRIWAPGSEGRVDNWRDVDPAWPDMPLRLFGAGTASGTFDFFTEAVNGEGGASRTDYTPTEDDNVTVIGVIGNRGAMGYFGIAYYEQNQDRIKALAVDAGGGAVFPTTETVADASYQPLSRPLFVYVAARAMQRPAVRDFIEYYLTHAERLAPEVGYVPLPDAAYTEYLNRALTGRTGTAFGGEADIGASIEEVMARPLAEDAPDEAE